MKLSDDSRRSIIEKIADLTYPGASSMLQAVYTIYPPGRGQPSDADTKMVHSYDELQQKLKNYSDDDLKKRLLQAQAEAKNRQQAKDKERAHVEALLDNAKATQDPRRDQALQKRAETIARDLAAKGGRVPSKKKVALTMACEDSAETKAATYERRIRKTW